MSEAIAFDTHRFVKNLTASGFTEAQAEALADEQVHLLNSNLATRSDIAAVKSGLEVKIEQVRASVETAKAELQRDTEKVRADLARWMLTGWVAQTGLLAMLFWYFFSSLPGG